MIWLSVREFAQKQRKNARTIYYWVDSGFIIDLGYRLVRDPTGHWQIGIPPEHPSFADFRSVN